MKNFFKSKTTLICFIVYILLTAFIFSQSLSSGGRSSESSGRVASLISKAVEFLTEDKITLEDDGKIKELYPTSMAVSGVDGELEVGKNYLLKVELLPKNEYPLCDLEFISSNPSAVTVDKVGVLTAVEVGETTITIKDKFSNLSSTIDLTVGDKVYIPKIAFGNLTGFSSGDNAVYYSSSNQTGAIYAIDFESEVDNSNLVVTSDSADVVLGNGRIYFYPKRLGDIQIKLTATYKSINGNEERDYFFNVNVKDKFMPKYSTLLTVSENSILLTTNQNKTLNLNLSEYQSGLTSAQKRVFYTVDSRFLKVDGDGEGIRLTPKKIGNSKVYIYYVNDDGLAKQEVDVEIVQGIPSSAKMVAPSSWAVNGKDLQLSVVGDGVKFSSNEFNWAVDGNATILGGKLLADKNGKYQVTATHKTIDGFTASLSIEVKYSFHTYVRKLVGHFSLFFILAIFAIVVYYRLAEILKPNKKTLLGSSLTLSAGLLTAGISELLQSGIFTSGRAPAFSDVLIDFAGYFLATAICFIIYIIYRKAKAKKINK